MFTVGRSRKSMNRGYLSGRREEREHLICRTRQYVTDKGGAVLLVYRATKPREYSRVMTDLHELCFLQGFFLKVK